jgi:sensor histidine kinase YesM
MLQHRDKETIPISEESALLQDYIFILKKRFGESLIIHSNIEKIEGNIVPLTLQILVENAVKHNIVSKSKPLTINILAKENYIIIENNLQAKPQPDNSTKFGLDGIVKRYALLTKIEVIIEQNTNFFIVKIPIL